MVDSSPVTLGHFGLVLKQTILQALRVNSCGESMNGTVLTTLGNFTIYLETKICSQLKSIELYLMGISCVKQDAKWPFGWFKKLNSLKMLVHEYSFLDCPPFTGNSFFFNISKYLNQTTKNNFCNFPLTFPKLTRMHRLFSPMSLKLAHFSMIIARNYHSCIFAISLYSKKLSN